MEDDRLQSGEMCVYGRGRKEEGEERSIKR
jgi:hypothetical protein